MRPGTCREAISAAKVTVCPGSRLKRNMSARSLFMRSGLKPSEGVMAAMRPASSSGEATRELARV